MKTIAGITITKRTRDSSFYGEIDGESYLVSPGEDLYDEFNEFYLACRSLDYAEREERVQQMIAEGKFPHILGNRKATITETEKPNAIALLTKGMQGLIDFFSEFGFTPSFRFVNTLAQKLQEGIGSPAVYNPAKTYVCNYFSLMDSSYKNEVAQKIKSAEFERVLSLIVQYGAPKQKVNSRLKVYYGPAGTGKTTRALEETKQNCIICNSSMLPADLMEDFVFVDGRPDFKPSRLWQCMENGEKITFDEINLLPFDTLRFLQGLSDGKTEFYYKNRPVHIKEGFEIIGTMNLMLGGMAYGLPEPLVDRCFDIEMCELTADQLAKAVMGSDTPIVE